MQNDRELITICLGGNTEAFGVLVLRYQNRLVHALTGVMGSVEDARDVAQETFVHAYQKLHTFRGESAFYSWLFRIALNSSTSYRRAQKKHASIDRRRDETGAEPPDLSLESSPSFSMEQNEQHELVRRVIGQLPEEFRVPLVLKEFEGLRYDEIAEICECPVGTVRSRIFRAREELKRKLEFVFRRQEKLSP